MTEHSRIESQCAHYLELLGFLVIRTHSSRNPPAENGIADLLAIRKRYNMATGSAFVNAAVIAVEVKIPPDDLSAEQMKWLTRAREQCVMILVVQSLDQLMEAVPR
jgi:hypothetical protein